MDSNKFRVNATGCVRDSCQRLDTARRKAPEDPRLSREGLREFLGSHGPVFFWSASGFLLIYLFGFVLGPFLLVFGYMVQQREKWPKALGYALGTGFVIYLGFQVILQIRFYPGLLITALLNYIQQ